MGRNDLQYTDEFGDLSVFVEPMANWTEIVVETAAIPDRSVRSREEVVLRLRRVFEHRGCSMIEADS